MELKPGYKMTEVGVIPEDWDVKTLDSVLSKGRLGGNYANQDAEAELPLMKMGNLARGNFDLSKVQFIKPGVLPEPAHRLVYGDVLFNTRNTLDLVGKVAIWRDEIPVAYYNSNLMRLEFDPDQVCSNEFANYSLNTESAISRLRGLATGTTSVAAIYTRDLLKLKLLVPPLPEQRAIAQALSDVDALLATLDKIIAKKRDLKQATMQQLLTGKTRLPGFSGNWEVKRLGEAIERIVGGGTPSRANNGYWNGSIPWVTVKDFSTFNTQQAQEYITDAGLKNSASNLIPAGTLITSTRMALGKAVIYHVDVTINQDLKALFLKPNQDVQFMRYWFEQNSTMIDSIGGGSTVKGISIQQLQAFEFNSPPTKEEQTAIATVLTDMDAELSVLEARRDKTRNIKQAMMQELLTGKTRLV